MPVIRRGSRVTGAAAAMGAFDAATDSTRRERNRTQQVMQQLQQRQQQMELQQGQQALQQQFQNEATTRRLDLQERSIAGRENRTRMAEATRMANGIPISGAGAITMATKLSELDRPTYERLFPQLVALSGSENPTPEQLDRLETLPDIYAALSGPYGEAVRAADSAAVETGFSDLLGDFVEDPEMLETDREWAAWHQQLSGSLERAQRSSGGATMAMMEPVYRSARVEAARIQQVKADRELYLGKYKAAFDASGVTEEKKRSAQLKMAEIGRSQNPRQTFVEAMVRLDPEFELAHTLGRSAGMDEGVTRATVAQVRASVDASAGSAPSRSQVRSQNAAAGSRPAGTVSEDVTPGLLKALGIESDERRKEMRGAAEDAGIDLADREAVRDFVRSWLASDAGVARVYEGLGE